MTAPVNWRARTMVGFDTETTGTNPETARIVTACVGLADKKGWRPTNWLIRQDEPIPAEATAVHGITTEQANAEGIDPAKALTEITVAIQRAWADRCILVGHNIVYDLTVLDRELQRHGLGELHIDGPIMDTLVIDKALDPWRKGKRQLAVIAEHYHVDLGSAAHGAEADALASTRIAWKLASELTGMDARSLMDWQRNECRDQKLSLADYFDRQGKPDTAADVRSHLDWPLTPRPEPAQEAA